MGGESAMQDAERYCRLHHRASRAAPADAGLFSHLMRRLELRFRTFRGCLLTGNQLVAYYADE